MGLLYRKAALCQGNVSNNNNVPKVSSNITTVTAPDDVKEVHKFLGWGFCGNGRVYGIGLPISNEYLRKDSTGNYSTYYYEIYFWTYGGPISNQSIGNSPWNNGYVTAVDSAIYVPLLRKKVIGLDGVLSWYNNGNPDSNGNVSYSSNAMEYVTTFNSYDNYGNPTSITEYSYDWDWNQTAVRNTSKTYFYNTDKNIVSNKPTQVTVSGGFTGSFVTTNTYDSWTGNLMQIKKYGTNGSTTDFGYDLSTNNLTSIKDANNHTTTFEWDFGRIKKKTNSLYSVRRSINRDGTIASETNGRNYTTSYTYDDNFRLTSITPPEGNPTTITYDQNGTYKKTSRDNFYSYTVHASSL